MLKLIPILIITIIFYFTAMAQVTIKEEVDLNFPGDSPESVTLPATTSYGKVWGSINNHAHNPFVPEATMKAIRIVAGGQTKYVGENCQGWIWPTSWAIDNVPSGTPVTVTVYAACEVARLLKLSKHGIRRHQTQIYLVFILNKQHSLGNGLLLM
jgi:hypothetical protein